MGYDFASVISQANAAFNADAGRSDNRYPILYPGIGKTIVKLLFCPKSNILMRSVRRHTCSDDRTKVMCYRTIPDKSFQDCPVCKVLEDIKNAKGIDLYKFTAKMRGIAYGQFISATGGQDRVQPNEIVLFMFPWTVYKAISETILTYNSQPELLAKIVASNKGPAFVINRSADNQYSVQLDGLNTYGTCNSDEEFNTLLESLPPLEECIVHNPPTDEEINNMNSFANELRQKHLMGGDMSGIHNLGQMNPASQYNSPPPAYNQQRPSTSNYNQAPSSYSNAAPQSNPQSAQGPTQPSTPTNSNQNHPACYGQQNGHDANECLMCPSQISCIEETRKRSVGQGGQGINPDNFPM